MRKTLLITVALLLSPAAVFAQGMKHMSVTGDAKPVSKTTEEKSTEPAAPESENKPASKALKPEEALKKIDTLSPWPYYTDLMTIGNDTALEKVIHSVTIDPGSVPPKGMFFLAKALADRKRFEEAAFYYYAGQLRATFDMARFPPYEVKDKKSDKGGKRTDDQKGNVPDAPPAMVNPHEELSVIALSIGSPIAKWAMADPSRLETVMVKVRDWDMATPYAYLPDYDASRAVPFETWPALLSKTRTDYFTRARQIAQGLKSVKPAAPAPAFSRP